MRSGPKSSNCGKIGDPLGQPIRQVVGGLDAPDDVAQIVRRVGLAQDHGDVARHAYDLSDDELEALLDIRVCRNNDCGRRDSNIKSLEKVGSPS